MKTWIEIHQKSLWSWITDCFKKKGDSYQYCQKCEHKEACDRTWEVVPK